MSQSNASTSRKYQRPRRFFSPVGILLGLALGVAVGLYVSWELFPMETVDVAPYQLSQMDKQQFMVAIGLAYAQDSDLDRAVNRLVALRLPGDPIQAMADTACELARTGYVNSSSGLRAVGAMMTFYQGQGRTGCADTLITAAGAATQVVDIQLPTNTPTVTPAATKTATPESAALATATPVAVVVPTAAPQITYEAISVNTACGLADSGQIQVFVYEINGATGIPAQPIRVRWNGGESTFYTGLKPERDPGYADFTMEENINYIVDMPGLAEPIQTALSAVPCTDPTTGERAITTYRVIFRALS
ncbi:MAG: hypothetical protein KME04_16630 [Pleurocapsa minor GSE-CHR-MK-17-07R]|jgi:hypothetical protein|nr:hypothetical protein [Pleurocapsa minor GSE-CHR-MK 17-07R]